MSIDQAYVEAFDPMIVTSETNLLSFLYSLYAASVGVWCFQHLLQAESFKKPVSLIAGYKSIQYVDRLLK